MDAPKLLIRPPGSAPGILVADRNALPTTLRLMTFDATSIEEKAVEDPAQIPPTAEGIVQWIDITGVGNVDLLQRIGHHLDLHPLLLEDVVNVEQRSKVESYGQDKLFLIARMPQVTGERFATEQLSVVLRPGLLVTFQERPGDCFELVRERLRNGNPRIRGSGSDYLAYALLDAVVDSYLPILDDLSDQLEIAEQEVIEGSSSDHLGRLHSLRRDLIGLRRAILPTRDAVDSILHDAQPGPFTEETRLFLRDCYDHAVRAVERADSYRELASSVLELHLTMVAHRSNEVMKVLTMIATIFIPLSFLAGLYGMNFDTSHPWNLPELSAPYGYPGLLTFMALIAGLLLWFFRRRGWF